MASPAPPSSPLSKLRSAAGRRVWLFSALAGLSALALLLSLLGLFPPRHAEPAVRVAYDSEQAQEARAPLAPTPRAAPLHRVPLWSFPLCAAPEQGARLYRLGPRGERPSFLVFCRDEYQLFAVEPASEPPRVTRLARFPLRGALPGGAAALDLDGDGVNDLALGVAPPPGVVHRPFSGMFWLRGRTQGGYEVARPLLEMPTVSAAAADLDGDGASELIVLTRGDPAAQRPGELWLFRGGASLARAAVLPVGLAPGDLAVSSSPPAQHALWVVTRKPGTIVQLRLGADPASWPSAALTAIPLPGAQAFVARSAGLPDVRTADQIYTLAPTEPPALAPLLEPTEVGPAVWLRRDAGDQRVLLFAKRGAFAILPAGERVARERSLPAGRSVLDVSAAGGSALPEQGVLLVQGEGPPAALELVVLPTELRQEAFEIALRAGAVERAPSEARVPLE